MVHYLRIPGGIGFFEAVTNNWESKNNNNLSLLIENIKLLQQLSSYITIVVISDETTFLAAFTKWSGRSFLLVWSTRILMVTRSHLSQLQNLHMALSKWNVMLLIITDDTSNIRCSVYVYLPYTGGDTPAQEVATWTPHTGLLLTSHLQFFPDKFSKLFHGPNLLVATEVNPFNKIISVTDPEGHRVNRVHFTGPVPKVVDFLSKALNFTYTYLRPPDGVWGVSVGNGSWSGMVGLVMREEVDIGAGPFSVERSRSKVVDFTVPILVDFWRILGVRGLPKVDPWGFLFPLSSLVWVAIMAALLLLAAAVFIMSSSFHHKRVGHSNYLHLFFNFIRILLQQDITGPTYWWERVILVVWMMVTLVLTRSYSGNLMALLAVRHISEPYQSLRDVVDDSSVKMIWEKDSGAGPILKLAESGIYREIAETEKVGRLVWRTHPQFAEAIDTLVRRGDHVLMEVDTAEKAYVAQDFTKTGECSFYQSREEFLQIMLAMIGPKNSPIVPALNKRIVSMTEAGLFFHWLKGDEPNTTTCYRTSSKITVNEALSLSNVW
ncbi:glutamate receptor U1-like isoform X2 [Cherax quadricarinatus]